MINLTKRLLITSLFCCAGICEAQEIFNSTELSDLGYRQVKNYSYNPTLCGGKHQAISASYRGIKSVEPIEGSTDTYYRFTFGVEEFETNELAKARIKDMHPENKTTTLFEKSCELIQAIDCGKQVLFLHTDALIFNVELNRMAALYFAVCKPKY